ncbi:FUSC family protein [Aridibaculum aurantiacum]|uniref:FUSC family protein n=1 Tax=Aridibaculum aurantiacum TaxID=2810307 RepID=UPI001A973375|nr:FUSC family membrane protein [Aridibaculum aurantiacum]
MDFVKQYRNFVNSHYFSEGLRMTAGILIPAFVMNLFDLLQVGIVMSLGALCVSITDSPGPVHHRRNGMVATTGAIFIMSLLTNAANFSPILVGLLLTLSSLFFSMLGVYGARPGAVGVSALVVVLLHMDESVQVQMPLLQQAALITAGGAWYTCFSLLLYSFRPYRMAQQTLGEWVQTVATYLQTRALLYKKDVNYQSIFSQLLQQQGAVQEKQAVLRELLLKARQIIKESTPTSRLLLMTFVNVSDLFEKIITSYSRYSEMHRQFDDTPILDHLYELIKQMADQLEEIGLAIKRGEVTGFNTQLFELVQWIKEEEEKLEAKEMQPGNLELFLSLRRTIQNGEDIVKQLENIQHNLQNGIQPKELAQLPGIKNLEKFVDRQPIKWQTLLDNLTLDSDIFRHTIRLTVALVAGFILAETFSIGHGYWILLTILVILKPAYSLTKKRNRDRLIGTVLGVLLGLLILQLVKTTPALLVIMVLLMAANFSFMRTNYFISVLLMTPYLLIFFYFLQPENFRTLLSDRVIDTTIGSVIAFAVSFLLFPTWEKDKIKPLMVKAMEKVKDYFATITSGISGEVTTTQQRLARKDAFIALANVSDTFNRMLNEPKYRQKQTEELQRFVMLLHMLVSYIATLGYYIRSSQQHDATQIVVAAAKEIQQLMENIINRLNGEVVENEEGKWLQKLNDHSNQLHRQRQSEVDNGMIETPTRVAFYELKSLAHQFNLIHTSAVNVKKLADELKLED